MGKPSVKPNYRRRVLGCPILTRIECLCARVGTTDLHCNYNPDGHGFEVPTLARTQGWDTLRCSDVKKEQRPATRPRAHAITLNTVTGISGRDHRPFQPRGTWANAISVRAM